MQSFEIRLECLRLAHRPDRSPSEVIAAAREYLQWVGGVVPQTTGENQPADGLKESKKLAPKSSDKPL